jgi:eukaryotic-like serine/threonine-protein kinase
MAPSSDGLTTALAREAARSRLFGRTRMPPRIGRHVILEQIGSGAMGVVYAAYDPELDRKLAVKVVRSGAEPAASRARLLREAQALARLSHPNVVHVYDVGTVDDDVYFAMEFLQGRTLTRWMQAKDLGWAEVVRVFGAAAQGLAAAHAVGLVHRDFKPDNAIVTDEGRVVVVDFGLVRSGAAVPEAVSDPGGSASDEVRRSLTREGSMVGTPAYMSPEQFRGDPADAKSDQFALCAALFEALNGVRPFAGDDMTELAAAVQSGAIRSASRSSVPAWLDALVRRGLSRDPADRFDDTLELAAELTKRRTSVALRALPVTVLLVIGSVSAWGVAVGDDPPAACSFDTTEWAGIWDAATRGRVETAMARAQVPAAEHAWQHVSAELDERTAELTRMRVDACDATRVQGVQSNDLLDRKMICLDRVHDQIAASVAVLQDAADDDVVLNVDELLGEIAPLRPCADAEYLEARLPPPADPQAAAEAEAIRQLVAEAASRRAVTQLDAALEAAEEARRRAELLAYAPVSAEATHALGNVLEARAAYDEAARLYREAYWTASDAGHDEAVFHIAGDLGFVVGDALGRPDEGLAWLRHAESAALRAGLHDSLDHFRAHRAGLQVMSGDANAAIPVLEEVVVSMASDDPKLGAAYTNLGAAFAQLGQWDRAGDAHRKAIASVDATYGADHPEYAKVLANLATAEASQGRLPEAERMLRQALEIYERTYDQPHPLVAQSLCSLGAIASDQEHYAEAIDAFERCIAIVVDTLGENHPARAGALANIGKALAAIERFDEALERYEEAIAIDDMTLAAGHPDRAYALLGSGSVLLRLGRATDAIEPLERAFALRDSNAIASSSRSNTELALARALWRSGHDRSRALELAEAARRHGLEAGEPAPNVAVEQWLAQD